MIEVVLFNLNLLGKYLHNINRIFTLSFYNYTVSLVQCPLHNLTGIFTNSQLTCNNILKLLLRIWFSLFQSN